MHRIYMYVCVYERRKSNTRIWYLILVHIESWRYWIIFSFCENKTILLFLSFLKSIHRFQIFYSNPLPAKYRNNTINLSKVKISKLKPFSNVLCWGCKHLQKQRSKYGKYFWQSSRSWNCLMYCHPSWPDDLSSPQIFIVFSSKQR